MTRLDEIESRCEAARIGPWKVCDDNEDTEFAPFWVINEYDEEDGEWFAEVHVGDYPTAKFISAARDDVPWLISEVRRLTAENERLREAQRWIPVTERLPEEHDSMFAKDYGTDQWSNAMWRKQSNQVIAALEFEDGTRMISALYTHDGKWKYTNRIVKQTVTHWRPLPDGPEGGERDG